MRGRATQLFWRSLLGALLLLAGGAQFSSASAACIVDDTGSQVCAEQPARLVSLYGAFTEVLWEIGAGERLVARTKNDTTIAAVTELPSVGTGLRPNVEYLLALRPDLVISRAGKAAGEALASLRERGLTVAAFDPRGVEDLVHTVERLGRLVAAEASATTLVQTLRHQLEQVRAVTAEVAPTERLQVVFEVRADPLTVAGSDGLVNEIIRWAGGRNAIRRAKKLIHLDTELLLHLDPDVYVVQQGPMNRNPLPPARRPHGNALRSVQAGRVLHVEEHLFSRPGPRVAEAAEVLSRFLYPALWQDR